MPRLAAVVLLAAALSTPAAAHAFEWSKTYPITGRPEVRIHAEDANIRFVVREAPEVRVHVFSRGWSAGRRASVTDEQVGNRIELDVREPRFLIQISFETHPLTVEVEAPRALDVELETGDGRAELPALSGRVVVNTGDGTIRAEGVNGDMRFSSGDGTIDARGLRGSLTARTGDGRINATGRFERLDLESGDGTIAVEARPGSRVVEPWRLSTHDGSLTLRVPADLAFDVDASSGDGSVTVDVPMLVSHFSRRHSVRGAVNGGGALVVLRTGDGRLRVQPIGR